MCHTSTHSAKGVARLFIRIGFGLALAFTGFAHYQDATYAESVGRGLGVLEPLGMVWGYVLPGLMIVGGLLLAFGIYTRIAAYLTAIALISIPAGLMLKSAITRIPLDATMPDAMNAYIWILVLMIALKGGCHGSSCCGPNGCACCDTKSGAPMSAPKPAAPVKNTPVKSAPVTPVATVKAAPAKKAPARKGPVRKSGKSGKSGAKGVL